MWPWRFVDDVADVTVVEPEADRQREKQTITRITECHPRSMDTVALESHRRKSLVRSEKHPELPLHVWNYTQRACALRHWNAVTRTCRGLVTGPDGGIVARSFPKFFNIEENRHKATARFRLYEKVDGSLVILFNYLGRWLFCTQGSFRSDQAMQAQKLLETLYPEMPASLDTTRAYSFEVIYPENRIVVDYGARRQLIYLATFNRTGDETNDAKLMKRFGVQTPTEIHSSSIEAFQAEDRDNAEGAVVVYENGQRAKVKLRTYVRLHKEWQQRGGK